MNDSSFGRDQQAIPQTHNPHMYHTMASRLLLGSVSIAESEPSYKQDTVSVELVEGGEIGLVGWPGAHFSANQNGAHSNSIKGLHGLQEGPLPGQQVVLGFINKEISAPVVIAKYPYNVSQKPTLEAAYFLPMTNLGHNSKDIVLGSYTGSYIALRGILPLPGTIQIEAITGYEVNSGASIDIVAAADYNVGAAVVSIEATGSINLDATPAVVVNSGTLPVAKQGDITMTMLGPMPILATGITVLVT